MSIESPLEATFTLHGLERIIAAERERERAACEAIARDEGKQWSKGNVPKGMDQRAVGYLRDGAFHASNIIATAIAARKKP